ncbi:MAG: TRAP transporter substrate-binding protein DctP [Deltaproteobacteria bacterium]|jgi:TRAP-type mannitol/chloroaromatic compound transport system substrate-binding protein|nr:TRAP transporter substrate-binding protein DctP [Deltaproteobacteria bacterium]
MRIRLMAIISAVALVLAFTACDDGVMNNPQSSAGGTEKPSFNWRLASVWGDGTFQFEGDRRFAETVTKLSGGRLTITAYGAGAIVPTTGVFDAVRNGTVECGGDWPSYWTGFNTAFDLLGSQVLGFNNYDYMNWIYGAGGLALYKELYGKYGMEYFPVAMSGMESGIRSIKRVTKLDDLAGMKIRFAGLIQGELIQKFGVTPVSMSLPEAYEGLQRGVIDAMEFSAPINDEAAKLQEVAKYWLAPGWHQTCSVYGVMINKASYDKLDDELKLIIEKAAKAVGLETMAEYGWGDSVATNKMIDYGVEVNWLSEEDLDRLEAAKNEVMAKLSSENPDYAKLAKAQMQYYRDYDRYRSFLGGWSFGRTPKVYPNLP